MQPEAVRKCIAKTVAAIIRDDSRGPSTLTLAEKSLRSLKSKERRRIVHKINYGNMRRARTLSCSHLRVEASFSPVKVGHTYNLMTRHAVFQDYIITDIAGENSGNIHFTRLSNTRPGVACRQKLARMRELIIAPCVESFNSIFRGSRAAIIISLDRAKSRFVTR